MEKPIDVWSGQMKVIPAPREEGPYNATILPGRGLDIGAGPGKPLTTKLNGGTVGIILDGRGRRPFSFQNAVTDLSEAERRESLDSWNKALDLYPGYSGVS